MSSNVTSYWNFFLDTIQTLSSTYWSSLRSIPEVSRNYLFDVLVSLATPGRRCSKSMDDPLTHVRINRESTRARYASFRHPTADWSLAFVTYFLFSWQGVKNRQLVILPCLPIKHLTDCCTRSADWSQVYRAEKLMRTVMKCILISTRHWARVDRIFIWSTCGQWLCCLKMRHLRIRRSVLLWCASLGLRLL